MIPRVHRRTSGASRAAVGLAPSSTGSVLVSLLFSLQVLPPFDLSAGYSFGTL